MSSVKESRWRRTNHSMVTVGWWSGDSIEQKLYKFVRFHIFKSLMTLNEIISDIFDKKIIIEVMLGIFCSTHLYKVATSRNYLSDPIGR